MTTISDAKRMAKALRNSLAATGTTLAHSESLEVVAHQLGYRDWNVLVAKLGATSTIGGAIPVLRIFSIDEATAFYTGYLGMTVDWEHRFEPGMPLYLQVSRSGLTLHLSQHHGDGTPGSALWIPVGDLTSLHAELTGREHAVTPGH